MIDYKNSYRTSRVNSSSSKDVSAAKGFASKVFSLLAKGSLVVGGSTIAMLGMNTTNMGHSLFTTGGTSNARVLSESQARAAASKSYPHLFYEAKKAGLKPIDHIPPIYNIKEYEKGVSGDYANIPGAGDYIHANMNEFRESTPAQTVGHELKHAFQAKQFKSNLAFDKAYKVEMEKYSDQREAYLKNKFEIDATDFEKRMVNNVVPKEIEAEALEHLRSIPYRKPSVLPNIVTDTASNLVKRTSNTLSKGYSLLSKVLR